MLPNVREIPKNIIKKAISIKCSALFILFLLSGCAFTKPVQVRIPIPLQCPVPTLPPKPDLPIYQLTVGSSPDVVAKAYVASVGLLLNHVDIIHRQVEG